MENHGIDYATAQAFALHVFPQLPVDRAEWMAGPTWLMEQWFHSHALDENAIGCKTQILSRFSCTQIPNQKHPHFR